MFIAKSNSHKTLLILSLLKKLKENGLDEVVIEFALKNFYRETDYKI